MNPAKAIRALSLTSAAANKTARTKIAPIMCQNLKAVTPTVSKTLAHTPRAALQPRAPRAAYQMVGLACLAAQVVTVVSAARAEPAARPMTIQAARAPPYLTMSTALTAYIWAIQLMTAPAAGRVRDVFGNTDPAPWTLQPDLTPPPEEDEVETLILKPKREGG